MAYLFAIVGLSFLIIVHELGHMMIARLSGMRVQTFSVGFGPVLLRWRGRRTAYQLALIPLGGFVQIVGMNPHEEIAADDPGSYANKSALARIGTIVAGPLTNYLTASVLMIAITLAWGAPRREHAVGQVAKGTPAAAVGLKPGDRIEAVDGKPTPTIDELVGRIQSSRGRTMQLRVRRDGKLVPMEVAAKKDGESYRLGFQFAYQLGFTDVEPGRAVLAGLYYPIEESRRALASLGQVLGKLFKGDVSDAKQMGGVVEIVYQLSQSFRESIPLALLFLAMLSAYLGLFNLLPVPALDGGRLLFLFSSILLRRPINQKLEHTVHTVGFLILIGLILMVTYCDVARRVVGP